MASITAYDSIDIDASPRTIFDVVSDYKNMHIWFPGYVCRYLNGDDFCEGLEVAHKPNAITQFTRRIDGYTLGQVIHESYIAGDIIGTGVWRFEQQESGLTRASFDCKVTAKKWIIALAFKLTGAKGHKDVYAKLLEALKEHCETKGGRNGLGT